MTRSRNLKETILLLVDRCKKWDRSKMVLVYSVLEFRSFSRALEMAPLHVAQCRAVARAFGAHALTLLALATMTSACEVSKPRGTHIDAGGGIVRGSGQQGTESDAVVQASAVIGPSGGRLAIPGAVA